MAAASPTKTQRAFAFAGLTGLSFALGAPAGFLLWLMLSVAYALCDLAWKGIGAASGWALFPLCACCAGGVCIGLWNARFKSAPLPFDQVMAQVKREGGYTVRRPFAAAVSFFLPIAAGGAVGPEAGLMGMVAAGCTWVGTRLRSFAARCGLQPDAAATRPFLTPWPRRIVYAAGIAGAFAGIAVYRALLPGGMALPRFAAPGDCCVQWIAWIALGALVGWLLVLLYKGCVRATKRIAAAFGEHLVAKTTVCGLVLGAAALALPYVLFPGTQQFDAIASSWSAMGAAALLATGVLKTCLVAFCLNMGWSGGPYLPLVFCGAVSGYGLAAALGADPAVCVCAVVCSLMGAFVGKFPGAFLFMLVLFAPHGILIAALCTAAGCLLPQPKGWKAPARR
ncbi:MAG: chloride channel protein [Slackia sp.]|nr:chloride channel protein [Slackia sp.]